MLDGRALGSSRARELVVEAVEAAATLMAEPAVAHAWDRPSVLEGMSIGALCAHLLRAAGATIAYLDRTPADREAGVEPLTAVTYFRAAVEAPIHDRIKEVSAAESAIGPSETAAACRSLTGRLAERLADEPEDRLVAALGDRTLTLDDFCRTRLIEVLLHLDDLARSVGVPTPETDPEGRAVVVDILIGIARDRVGDWPLIHALARRERLAGDPPFPVF